MTPFPHLKQKNQEAGGTPGVKKFQRKLQMNFKEDFFLGHPVVLCISAFSTPPFKEGLFTFYTIH